MIDNVKLFIKQITNLDVTDSMQSKLNTYCDFLLEENQKYNLTAITQPSEVWEKHFADSICGSIAIKEGATVCDVGCGAGFPSIPLAIVRSDVAVTLVDSLEKRVNFCRTLCEKIDLDATFVHARAEDFARKNTEVFDVATARAVAPLNVLLEYTSRIVKMGGIVLAYKTDLSETEIAQNACKTLGLQLESHFNFVLPSGGNRCLLTYRKVAHTPTQYPRGQNNPRKKPL